MDTSASPQELFRKNSRSFSLAARFFAPEDQLSVARIYRFCRYLDDLADDTQTGDRQALDLASERLTGKTEAHPTSVEADFLNLARERAIPLEPAIELIAALRADCGSRSIRDADELISFAYGVAGTVGEMLRHVIGARDARAVAFAVDLGIALQLSNVIRDIGEDARRGRFYLPASWVEPEMIKRAIAGETHALEHVDNAVRRVLDLSDFYYRSARRGFAYIPYRNRRVIFLAAALYQAIGKKVVRSGPGAWCQRTVVGPVEKFAILLRSWGDYRRWKREAWSSDSEPRHDEALHRALLNQAAIPKSGTP